MVCPIYWLLLLSSCLVRIPGTINSKCGQVVGVPGGRARDEGDGVPLPAEAARDGHSQAGAGSQDDGGRLHVDGLRDRVD